MKIVKHTHACVEISDGQGQLLIDPGTFTPEAADLVARNSAILLTHEHIDHLDIEVMEAALRTRTDLTVWGPSAVTDRWAAQYPDRVHAVRHGDTFTADGIEVAVHGECHAAIHRDIPQVANVGYLVADSIYHPGDAYHVPQAEVSTLLLPTSGPWTHLAEAVDYVRAVAPNTLVQIHELMLSEIGQRSTAMFVGPEMLGRTPLTLLPAGTSIDV